MNAVSIRVEWVGRTIDGRFPLIAWLGGSGNSGVFLTELTGPTATTENTGGVLPRKAAIKLIPASSGAENQLAIWASAASLSHPHLARILHFGRAETDGVGLLYVVYEVADEILSQILPDRPLTPAETRQMLGPILDALAYLHARGLVHGHVKPSNVLVVNDAIKLSTDGLVRAGRPAPELMVSDMHRAPEITTGAIADSADMWSLGVTIVEALTTQQPLVWDANSTAEAQMPASVPKPLDEIARECLRVDPSRRATVDDVRALLEGRPRTAAAHVPHLPHHPHRLVERTASPKIPLIPLIVGFIFLAAIVIGLRSCRTNAAPMHAQKAVETPSVDPDSRMPGRAPAPQIATGPISRGAVLNRIVPDVPRSASDTIRGTVIVTVRVTVNPTGVVTNADLESRGPSAYFARLATESARNWTFRPPQQYGRPVASAWLLHYAFQQDGTDVTPTETSP